jgi:hypothetical protein
MSEPFLNESFKSATEKIPIYFRASSFNDNERQRTTTNDNERQRATCGSGRPMPYLSAVQPLRNTSYCNVAAPSSYNPIGLHC